MSTETALTVAERAAIAIGAPAYEIALVDLVKESASIVQIKDKIGYQQAHSARMRLKLTRVEIQKRAKDAREDAQAFSKAGIAEEKRLVALVCPEEDRLQGLQDVWDAAREAEKQARIQAEEARVAKHRANIDAIRDTALHSATTRWPHSASSTRPPSPVKPKPPASGPNAKNSNACAPSVIGSPRNVSNG